MMASRCVVKDRLGTTPMDYACGSVGRVGGFGVYRSILLVDGQDEAWHIEGTVTVQSEESLLEIHVAHRKSSRIHMDKRMMNMASAKSKRRTMAP
jgi:hypothetical protein